MTSLVEGIAHGLRESFYMAWDTLWALILGFALSGAVQAFVSRDKMRASLGGHRPAAVTRASFFGAVSSSCSYAASALAKSLVVKGADFTSAMVFMFASTNLVLELGLVMLVLMGWQFLVAQYIGGVIMIVLIALAGALWFRGRALDRARRVAEESSGLAARGEDGQAHLEEPESNDSGTRAGIKSIAGWSDAAGYTFADLRMLRKEIVFGFLAAGFITALVPVSVWNALFIPGHGLLTAIENAIVGPFIAMLSCVCSIGNVALAAALWVGGISFGGVIAFVFADLIALPLLLIYRRMYGAAMMWRMLAIFWAVMSLAGLTTEGIFAAAGAIPSRSTSFVMDEQLSWNYTTFLNIAMLLVLAVLVYLRRNRDRFGAGASVAIDPVCGMQVEIAHAPARMVVDGKSEYFCSEHCMHRFAATHPTTST